MLKSPSAASQWLGYGFFGGSGKRVKREGRSQRGSKRVKTINILPSLSFVSFSFLFFFSIHFPVDLFALGRLTKYINK